jgi:hypothetical protein
MKRFLNHIVVEAVYDQEGGKIHNPVRVKDLLALAFTLMIGVSIMFFLQP